VPSIPTRYRGDQSELARKSGRVVTRAVARLRAPSATGAV
jgi:hypothetical protein